MSKINKPQKSHAFDDDKLREECGVFGVFGVFAILFFYRASYPASLRLV